MKWEPTNISQIIDIPLDKQRIGSRFYHSHYIVLSDLKGPDELCCRSVLLSCGNLSYSLLDWFETNGQLWLCWQLSMWYL